jgi:hypothetical protein
MYLITKNNHTYIDGTENPIGYVENIHDALEYIKENSHKINEWSKIYGNIVSINILDDYSNNSDFLKIMSIFNNDEVVIKEYINQSTNVKTLNFSFFKTIMDDKDLENLIKLGNEFKVSNSNSNFHIHINKYGNYCNYMGYNIMTEFNYRKIDKITL